MAWRRLGVGVLVSENHSWNMFGQALKVPREAGANIAVSESQYFITERHEKYVSTLGCWTELEMDEKSLIERISKAGVEAVSKSLLVRVEPSQQTSKTGCQHTKWTKSSRLMVTPVSERRMYPVTFDVFDVFTKRLSKEGPRKQGGSLR